MKINTVHLILWLCTTLLLTTGLVAWGMTSANYRIGSSELNSGGGTRSAAGGHAITFDTIGGPVYGNSTSANYILSGGTVPVLASQSDTDPPTSAITAPTSGATLTGASYSITGTAADDAVTSTYAYIPNSGSDNVSIIDTHTNTVVSTLAVGAGPRGVAANQSGTRVYVANEASNNVSVIDTSTDTVVATVGVGAGCCGIAVNPSGTRAYVANFGSDNVSVIDTSTNTVVATVGVGAGPIALGQFISNRSTGSGVQKVEVSTDGGATWHRATGTTSWSYGWTLPPSGGSRTIKSRATDNAGNVQGTPASVTVSVTAYGSPELPHYNWNAAMIPGGNDCAFCHVIPSSFLSADFRKNPGFCYSCHNAAGTGHSLGIYSSRSQHALLANATTAGRRRPTYGNLTGGEKNNIPASRLKDGYKVTCATCHNAMKKSDDCGRTWELTSGPDRYTYRLVNGGWSAYGNLVPKVYRDTTLWGSGGPTYSKTKKGYLVNPSEYTYNEMSGFIRFKSQQASSSYIYVTPYYPYLRAPMLDNSLCSDCHTEATHKDINCLTCHQAHNTGNLKGIRENVRTMNFTTIPVKFLNYTKANSFADGDTTYDGICEVCHTQTKYYRRDGTGFANHSGGVNQNGKDCTACHSHAAGFGK